MELNSACKIFLNKFRIFPYIESIYDTGNEWVMTGVNSDGHLLDIPGTAINKITGETRMFFPPDELPLPNKTELINIEVPEEFRYPGEIIDE